MAVQSSEETKYFEQIVHYQVFRRCCCMSTCVFGVRNKIVKKSVSQEFKAKLIVDFS